MKFVWCVAFLSGSLLFAMDERTYTFESSDYILTVNRDALGSAFDNDVINYWRQRQRQGDNCQHIQVLSRLCEVIRGARFADYRDVLWRRILDSSGKREDVAFFSYITDGRDCCLGDESAEQINNLFIEKLASLQAIVASIVQKPRSMVLRSGRCIKK
jgi:hypothetical protein